MGAWDASVFGNDDAADWAGDLVDGGSDKTVRDTLDLVANWDSDEYLEASLAGEALAAAEIVATAVGHPPEVNPHIEGALAWATGRPQLAELVPLAICTVIRVRAAESELCELWEDAGAAAMSEWAAVLDGLLKRLS